MDATDQKQGAEAFGREFGALMKRIDLQCHPLPDPDRRASPAEIRLDIGRTFARELEDLIARHGVSEAIAEYVRHVVREGFEVAFDLMDPSLDATKWPRTAPRAEPQGG